MPRSDSRRPDQLRPITLEAGIAPHASGSVLIGFGATRVICAATIEPKVPSWMKQQGVKGGWLTAEYSMLPYSTLDRKPRDISKGKIDGRTVEIQRLIGRSLRAVLDLEKLGENTLWVDCDVLQADGCLDRAALRRRVFADAERARLDPDGIGFLIFLEHNGIIDAIHRELVLDRVMALDQDEVDLDDLKWVVLMVLFNQPGAEAAYAWMESQIFVDDPEPVH